MSSHGSTSASRCARLLIGLIVAAVLCGCEPPSPGQLLQDWELAVAKVTDSDLESRSSTVVTRFPGRRALALEVSDLRVGWLDFFAIQGCNWGTLVGERNSPLGKVMPRSRRLVYELKFLEAAGPCLEGLSPDRRQKFEEAVDAKRRELGRHVSNAVWAGPEIERFLSSSSSSVLGRRTTAQEALSEVEAAVEAEFKSPADGEALESALANLHRAKSVGPLLRDLTWTIEALESVASVLERLEPKTCDTTAKRLVHLFEDRYVPILQPRIAELSRDVQPILTSLAAIYERTQDRLGEPIPTLDRYHATVLQEEGEDALGPRFRAASVRHARAWGPVLAACGRSPGS